MLATLLVPMLPEGPDLIIILVLALLLFGGSRLAGVGKSAGQAIREFKEETSELHGKPAGATAAAPAVPGEAARESAPVAQPAVSRTVTEQTVTEQTVAEQTVTGQTATEQSPAQDPVVPVVDAELVERAPQQG